MHVLVTAKTAELIDMLFRVCNSQRNHVLDRSPDPTPQQRGNQGEDDTTLCEHYHNHLLLLLYLALHPQQLAKQNSLSLPCDCKRLAGGE